MLPVSDYRLVKKSQDFNPIGRIRVRLLVAFSIVVVGLFFAQLVFANSLATDGQKLAQINSEIANLEANNMTIKVQIAQESSLKTLTEKAQTLGFAKPNEVSILK